MPVFNVADLPERFQRKILVREDGCWEWTGARNKSTEKNGGYGRVWWNGRCAKAHQVVYELLVGPIPPDRPEPDHTCHDPTRCHGGGECPHRPCVNPAHLEPVTSAENKRRARSNRRRMTAEQRDRRNARRRKRGLTPEQRERKTARDRARRQAQRDAAPHPSA